VTAKYLKVRVLSTYDGRTNLGVYQWQLFGALQAKPPKVKASPVATAAIPGAVNLLAPENGGHVLVAPSDDWAGTISGNEQGQSLDAGKSAVFAFKDEHPATFDMFTMLIPGTRDSNVKEFELLQGNESPTGAFQSIGKFQTQNVKLFNTPYQEFKFSPVTAKYLKVIILSAYAFPFSKVYQIQLFGVLQ
jgi:Sad1 / UNC-like C-terminal